MALLDVRDLRKQYRSPDGNAHTVVDVPAFSLDSRQQVALSGGSGTGKTTFLHLIAGILRADSGSIMLGDVDVVTLSESGRDRFRAQQLGYVFQSFHLLPGYTALENVILGMTFGPGPDPKFARELLGELGLDDRMDYRPSQLSIGQQQRVALARALANRPRLVLADEPTGSLDRKTAEDALAMVRRLCETHEAALLLVSHDPAVLDQFERAIPLEEINCVASGDGVDPETREASS